MKTFETHKKINIVLLDPKLDLLASQNADYCAQGFWSFSGGVCLPLEMTQ